MGRKEKKKKEKENTLFIQEHEDKDTCDLSSETTQGRGEWDEIFTVLREKTTSLKIVQYMSIKII